MELTKEMREKWIREIYNDRHHCLNSIEELKEASSLENQSLKKFYETRVKLLDIRIETLKQILLK